MMLIASWTLWTPASSTTISFEPCFVTSGSLTPSLSIRFRITVTERSRAPGGSFEVPRGGSARSTTSRPPWRSRPRVAFLCAGEPGITSRATPARATRISPTRMRCDRRSATCTAGRLPGRFLGGRLVLGLGFLPGLELVLFLFFGPDDPGHGTARDADVRAGRDLDEELVVGDGLHVTEEAAGGDDLVADLDVLDQRVLLGLAAPLRPDQEQPEEREEDHDDEDARHDRNGIVSRPSASSLYAAKPPLSIASRAPAVRSSRKRRLCRLSRRRPRSSCWFTRWRRYARLKRAHAGQAQPSSSGRGSRAKRALRRLSRPSQVRALPVRAVRVGRTQSNMSIPRSTTSSTPSGSPMPMK